MPIVLLRRGKKYRKENNMARTLPDSISVRGREVILGSGPAAAAYCATRRAAGFAPPLVFEQNLATGGMFAQLLGFEMNSQNWAGLESIRSPGPSRVMSGSRIDDLNWIPNSEYQVRDVGAYEYPHSTDMRNTIAKTLAEYAEVYTGVTGIIFRRSGQVLRADGANLGTAKRILFAGGLIPRNDYSGCKAVMSGYDFMVKPPRELHNKRIALVGGGDTAAQCAAYMLGQGIDAPATPPYEIHWYGGDRMPVSKNTWAQLYHARFSGLARHFPQSLESERSVIRPYPVRGSMIPLGGTAMVNGLAYDLVIMATGFRAAPCMVSAEFIVRVGGMSVAKSNEGDTIDGLPTVYKIGTAAGLTEGLVPIQSRFPAAQLAMYQQLPRVAALAASLT
jgi:hypothetical protein